MGRRSASGSGIRDEQPGSYFLELRNPFLGFLGLKYINSLMRLQDPGSGIRDGDSSDPGPGMEKNRIRDKHPGSATLPSRHKESAYNINVSNHRRSFYNALLFIHTGNQHPQHLAFVF
jgi:hypothetical protein